jgi:hypothetical protein
LTGRDLRGCLMGRKMSEKSKENFKRIIDIIREKQPVAWTELKKFTQQLPDKTLSRSLEYLAYWGLIKKDEEGHWNWYENIRTYDSETEYNLAIEHSRNLDRGLQGLYDRILERAKKPDSFPLLKLNGQDYWESFETSSMENMAFEHAKTVCPEFVTQYEQFQKLMIERYELQKEIRQLVHNLKIGEVEKKKSEFDILKNIYHWKEYSNAKKAKINPDEMWKWLVPKEYRKNIARLIEKVPQEKLERIMKLEAENMELAISLTDRIQELHIQIMNGRPLQGKCELCPKIVVKRDEA